ncbi:dead end protein homolog 1 [Rhinophrynus dorsalis]
MWINSINTVNKAALLKWVQVTGIELVQVNGQRKYGGPPQGWIGDPPGSGSEVFIGKIPQDIYEDILIPLFQSVGKLYEFRLMMTFTGLNRGFAYARYVNRRQAISAIATLNGFEIISGCKIVVLRSTEKSELTLDGLPATLDHSMLWKVLEEATLGVFDVSLHPSPTKSGHLMAIVKYNSHRSAAMAKKTLCEGIFYHSLLLKHLFTAHVFNWVSESLDLDIKGDMKDLDGEGSSHPDCSFVSHLAWFADLIKLSFSIFFKLDLLIQGPILYQEVERFLRGCSQLLHGHALTVDWLKNDVKLKLRPPDRPRLSHVIAAPQQLWNAHSGMIDKLSLSPVDCLNISCQKMNLGQPVYLIKLFNQSTCGWLRFWYQVVIPKYHIPFSGYSWIIGENLELAEKYKKAKDIVAIKILSALGWFMPTLLLGFQSSVGFECGSWSTSEDSF